MWYVPVNNNQELIPAHYTGNQGSVKWRSFSIPSENVSKLLVLNTAIENNQLVDSKSVFRKQEKKNGNGIILVYIVPRSVQGTVRKHLNNQIK